MKSYPGRQAQKFAEFERRLDGIEVKAGHTAASPRLTGCLTLWCPRAARRPGGGDSIPPPLGSVFTRTALRFGCRPAPAFAVLHQAEPAKTQG